MKQLTSEEAIKMGKSEIWKEMTSTELAAFQLAQKYLCVPIGVYYESLEKALKRPVFSNEIGWPENLKEELIGVRKAPSFNEILSLIPKEKLLVVEIKGD